MEPTFYGLLAMIGILVLLWAGSELPPIIRKIRAGKVRYTGKHRDQERETQLRIFDEIHEDIRIRGTSQDRENAG